MFSGRIIKIENARKSLYHKFFREVLLLKILQNALHYNTKVSYLRDRCLPVQRYLL